MGRTHAGARREDHAAPTQAPARPELTLGLNPETILALQRTAGNQAVLRAVTVELRKEPPPPPIGIFVLPIPIYTPVPVWISPPVYVAAPPNNVIYNNIHNTVVINNVTNTVTITNSAGKTTTMAPPETRTRPIPSILSPTCSRRSTGR